MVVVGWGFICLIVCLVLVDLSFLFVWFGFVVFFSVVLV